MAISRDQGAVLAAAEVFSGCLCDKQPGRMLIAPEFRKLKGELLHGDESMEKQEDEEPADTQPGRRILISKLNPVTERGHLEAYFSRYGKLKSVQVPCDKTTGFNFLHRAVVVFEAPEDCQIAYDNLQYARIHGRSIVLKLVD